MTETAFTPGPWSDDDSVHGNGSIIHIRSDKEHPDLEVCVLFSESLPSSIEVNRSNAHLIAAAPELYEALKDLSEAFQARVDGAGGTNTELRELAAAREALSKARGEDQ